MQAGGAPIERTESRRLVLIEPSPILPARLFRTVETAFCEISSTGGIHHAMHQRTEFPRRLPNGSSITGAVLAPGLPALADRKAVVRSVGCLADWHEWNAVLRRENYAGRVDRGSFLTTRW